MASIKKVNNAYKITVSTGRDSKGKQLLVYTTYHPTCETPKKIEKEVEQYARDFEEQVRTGKYLNGEHITFQEFTEEWKKDWAVDHLTKSQVEQYYSTLQNRIYPSIGNMKLSKITSLKCQSIVKEMIDSGLSPKTVRRDFSVMNSVFKFAYRMNVIQENPCSRCELPKLDHNNELHYFTLKQAKRFLSALDMTYTTTHKCHNCIKHETGEPYHVEEYTEKHKIPTQFKAYFYLAIYGGFRRGELIALTWKDIDFKAKTINITKATALTKEGMIIKSPKTVSGIRSITMPDICFTVLNEWKEEEKQYRKQLGSYWKGSGNHNFDENNIFIQDDGSMMYLDTPYNRFKEIISLYNKNIEEQAKNAINATDRKYTLSLKLPSIRLHDLRHTSATLLLSEGTDIETVSHRLGHSKASVTLDVYGHALEAKDTIASNVLSNLFSE